MVMLMSTCAQADVRVWELPFMDVMASWPSLALAFVVCACILFLVGGSLMLLLKVVNTGAERMRCAERLRAASACVSVSASAPTRHLRSLCYRLCHRPRRHRLRRRLRRCNHFTTR